MADNETIADIIAEKRRRVDELESSSYKPHQFLRDRIAELRQEADRLDAAHKRERAKIEADALTVGGIVEAAHRRELSKNVSKNGADFGQLGDAAKLREALDYVRGMVGLFCNEERISYDEWQGCDDMISAALSAPPRNCDRFATVDEARKAHEAICERYGKCHNGCPLNNEEHYSAFDCFEAWLFAQAEGGAE